MDGLAAAASITAIVDISAKIASLCFQYSVAVRDAEDIEHLGKAVANVKNVLEEVQLLLDGQDKTQLSATHKLSDSLKDCHQQLQGLKTQLEPGKAREAMHQVGLRAQGIALAQKELGTGGRTIFFEGDGSFQATAQELSTIIRYKLDAYIFIMNNDSYTFERLIHGLHEYCNDVARWRYLKAPEMFGAPNGGSYEVETHDVGT